MQFGSGPGMGLHALATPVRNHFYYDKLMDVLQFEREQVYLNRKRWLMNRLAIGAGVLCGLEVVGRDGELCVRQGVAIDDWGREIIVPGTRCLDPWLRHGDACDHLGSVAPRPDDVEQTVYLCLKYRECPSDLTRVQSNDCNTASECVPDAVAEVYGLHIHDGLPPALPAFPCDVLMPGTTPDVQPGVPVRTPAAETYQIVATIDVGGNPIGVATSGDGKRVIVINDAPEQPRIQILDVATNQVVKDFSVSDRAASPLGGVTVAPDGGTAFVTHARGVLQVDIEAVDPGVVGEFSSDFSYGACAAVNSGKYVYAINRHTNEVDKIAILPAGGNRVGAIPTPGPPNDLAVTRDSRLLYVSDATAAVVLRVTTHDDQVVETTPSDPSRSLAAREGEGESVAYAARKGEVEMIAEGGGASTAALAAEPADTAFTSDEQRYYVVNNNPDTAIGEIVILRTNDLSEVRRLTVGKHPTSVAVVPGARRGYIANLESGSVSVVDQEQPQPPPKPCPDVPHGCNAPIEEPCVVLATVQLLPGRSIGQVDACTYRRVVYSNAVLFDMILCLATRIEECCGHRPPSAEAPRVEAVEFLGREVELAGVIRDTRRPVLIDDSRVPYAIRVRFTVDVDPASVTAGGPQSDPASFSFLIRGDGEGLPQDGAVRGILTQESSRAYRFEIVDREGRPSTFPKGGYELTLFGDPHPQNRRPSIRAAQGGPMLDGDPTDLGTLPSGDGTAGGTFHVRFDVVSP